MLLNRAQACATFRSRRAQPCISGESSRAQPYTHGCNHMSAAISSAHQSLCPDAPGTRLQVWFHGGAFIAGSAEAFKRSCGKRAVETGTVVFAPDLGTAPETSALNRIHNGEASLRFVLSDRVADRFRIDRTRVALSGEGSGGGAALGVCAALAQKSEAALVKVCVTDCAAVNNDFITVPEAGSEDLHKAFQRLVMDSAAYLITDNAVGFDWSGHSADPAVFPGLMAEALLPKLPPVALLTAEFDHFRRGNEMFAKRLKPHGNLIGMYIQPGCGHALGTPKAEQEKAQVHRRLFDLYL